MSTEHEKIIGRIREGLRVAAPVPGRHGMAAHPVSETEAAKHIPEWLPLVGPTFEERVTLFRTHSVELRTDFRLVESRKQLLLELRAIAITEDWKKVACHDGELLREAAAELFLPICRTDEGYDVNELEACDAGITGCDVLVAQTGSVVVTSRSAGGRALSVLPPHHVVLARREQLVPDLPAAFACLKEKYGSAYPSFISLITGPSRTGDIERILVLGAHGPRKLTILCE